MQIDMHYFGTYALARSAGIPPEQSQIIAHSAQYVDDAVEDIPGLLASESFYLPIMTSHKPLDYQNMVPGTDHWRVWVCFHFLPGNSGETIYERMVCQKGEAGNSIARSMLDFVLANKNEPFGLHLAGIAAHVFEDTFAHYGFSGIASDLNAVHQSSIRIRQTETEDIVDYVWGKAKHMWRKIMASGAEVSRLGHGGVATLPDRPYLSWEYEYEQAGLGGVQRNNQEDYLEACRLLQAFFAELKEENRHMDGAIEAVHFDDMEEPIRTLIQQENSKEVRSKHWKKAIQEGNLFPSLDGDAGCNYEQTSWDFTTLCGKPFEGRSLEEEHACLFMTAARAFRSFIMEDVLRRHELAYF